MITLLKNEVAIDDKIIKHKGIKITVVNMNREFSFLILQVDNRYIHIQEILENMTQNFIH